MELVNINQTLTNLIDDIQYICKEYNIYNKIVEYKNGTIDPDAGLYLIAGLEPIHDNVNPIDIIERNKRHSSLFFPDCFAIRLTGNNTLNIINKITAYCSEAEFIATIFKQFNKNIPYKIRKDELYPLIEMNEGAYNPNYSESMRKAHIDKLKEYFDDVAPSKDKDKEWKDFYRSEKYDGKKSHFSNLISFKKRHEQEVSLETLFKGTSSVKKITIAEHEYLRFKHYLKECYPDVDYATGKIFEVNHGMLDDDTSPLGKTISYEEYCEILEEKFASHQFNAIKDLKPSYFKYIDIFYKESDEVIVAKILNDIQLRYAKSNDYETLIRRDDVNIITIPYTNAMNFVSLAKSNNLLFHIDNIGRYSKPSLEYVNIVINKCDNELVKQIISRIAKDKISSSHAIMPEQYEIRNSSLSQRLEGAKKISEQYNKVEKEKNKMYDKIQLYNRD